MGELWKHLPAAGMTHFRIQKVTTNVSLLFVLGPLPGGFSSGTPMFISSNFFPNVKFKNKTEQNGLNFRWTTALAGFGWFKRIRKETWLMFFDFCKIDGILTISGIIFNPFSFCPFVLSFVYNFLLFKVNSYTKVTMFYVLHNLVSSIRLRSPLILLKLSWL